MLDPATITILGFVVAGPVGGALAARYIKPRLSSEVEGRIKDDYINLLRKTISDHQCPADLAVPPWPERLLE